MNGDGSTDFVIVRNLSAGNPSGQMRWFTLLSPPANTISTFDWGIASDFFIPADYDGDFKDDIAIWRSGTNSTFWILQSQTQTFRVETFGQTGDDPSVVGDYNNDNRDDVAVYRDGINPGDQSRWYYRTVPGNGNPITVIDWGVSGDLAIPGDYDADGRNDFVVERNDATQARFFTYLATTGMDSTGFLFGNHTDVFVPGDYDNDDRTDICTSRLTGGNWFWSVRPSNGGAVINEQWGIDGDIHTQGDYDADGRTDFSIWRFSDARFYVITSGTRNIFSQAWGDPAQEDFPVAAYNQR
jgi:hypothetical protein